MVTSVLNDHPRNSETVAKAMRDCIDESDIEPMMATELGFRLIAKQYRVSDRDGAATKILTTQWEAEMKEQSNLNLGAALATVLKTHRAWLPI